jgi:hypothetical protein
MLKIATNVRVEVFDLEGKTIRCDEFKNLYTTLGINLLRDALAGTLTAPNDGAIRYLAVGEANTAPNAADTRLSNETFRKAITASHRSDGQLETITYLAPSEAVGQIEELGWFCGPSAVAARDSGTILARVLYSRLKTNLESIKVTRTDTIAEA